MTLMLRPEDRIDRWAKVPPLGRKVINPVFRSAGIRGAGPGACVAVGEVGLAAVDPVADPEPVQAARLSRGDWLMRGFIVLAQSGHQGLQTDNLCSCPGGTGAGFLSCFGGLRAFEAEMICLWEEAARMSPLQVYDTEGPPALARLLDLAEEFCSSDGFDAAPGFAEEPDPAAIERAIRAWAREEPAVAEALARIDAWRLAELQALLVAAGLSQRRAAERAAVFYAARLGFDHLRESTDIMPGGPMRALALAILGAKEAPLRPV